MRHTLVAAVAGLSVAALPAPAASAAETTSVVVREHAGAGAAAERAVLRLGGRVERRLPLIDGFSARVRPSALATLRAGRGVRSVTPDRAFTLHSGGTAVDPAASLDIARATIGAGAVPGGGAGVDVAIVDSGVAPLPALEGRVAGGVDLSADARQPGMAGLDAFGHGTHLAGVVATVAPQSRIVDVRVADHAGETSLVRILAGLDWAVRNADRDGRSIGVINLSFGADPAADHRDDPLAAAVERAWTRGIVVVAAAGNGGADTTSLDSPAYDPYVVAAGAQDTIGTGDPADDLIAEFSTRGSAARTPDVVAPGVGIVSLRVPGGHLDEAFPQARIGDAHFRGSGTSQAAAVVSGAAALLASARPELAPDEVKALLRATARPLSGVATDRQGAGTVDLAAAVRAAVPAGARQSHPAAHGQGPARGGAMRLQLAIENPEWWRANSWTGSRGSADDWSANRWTANRWTANRWTANRWTANRWTANRWTANRWTANRWTGAGWDAGS